MKRNASSDNLSAPSGSKQRTVELSSTTLPTLQESITELNEWIQPLARAIQDKSDDSGVLISKVQIKKLQVILNGLNNSDVSQPAASKEDIIELLLGLNKTVISSIKTLSRPSQSKRLELPSDIIRCIIDQLRSLPSDGSDEFAHLTSISSSQASHRQLKSLSTLNKSWERVVGPLFRSEIHLNDPKRFPSLSKALLGGRGDSLTSVIIKVYDFEYTFQKNSDDGFFLPTILTDCPNLLHLSILSDRSPSSSLRRTRREGTNNSFISFTGGIHLPDVIATKNLNLQSLIYGPMVTISDINLFSGLLNLKSLALLGELDLTVTTPAIRLNPITSKLSRFYAPLLILSPSQLSALFISAREKTGVKELAFVMDVEGFVSMISAITPLTLDEDQIQATVTKYVNVFKVIGSNLNSLALAIPNTEGDGNRMRLAGFPNILGLGGNGLGGALGAFGAAMGGALPNPILPAVGAVPNLAAGGIGGVGGGAGGVGGAARMIQIVAQGFGNNGAGAFIMNMGGGAMGGGMGGISLDPTPYFQDILIECMNLVNLTLIGRRFDSSIVDLLSGTDIKALTLSHPIDDEARIDLLESLAENMKNGSLNLKTLELSARAGDFKATERRILKAVCDEIKVEYKST